MSTDNQNPQVGSGLEVKELAAAQEYIAKLEKIIEASKAAAAAASKETDDANTSHASSKERWAIVLDEGRDTDMLPFIPVGVNGRVYQIIPSRVVEVPPEVLEALDHAILDKSYTKVDSLTGMPNGANVRKVRRFPYQKLGLAIDVDGKRVRTFEDLNTEV